MPESAKPAQPRNRILPTLLLRIVALSLLLVNAAAAQTAAPGPLLTQVFGGGSNALVVVLHGDLSSGDAATYHVSFAQRIAQSNPGVTSVALIRPGYQAGNGATSPGSNNNRRDHYTRRNNTLVAQTVANLANAVGARRIILVGHSGGAAQIGGIIANNSGIVDTAILVSCPCDIPTWRQMRGRSNWSSSQNPISLLGRVDRNTRIIAITGARDDNTFPVLAQQYIAAAQSRGIPAAYLEVAGAGHSFGSALERATLQAVNSEIRR